MTFDRHSKPRLRQVEPVPVIVDGQRSIALKDPLQLSDRTLCFSREALAVLALLDGTNSLLDIQAGLTGRSGRLVFMDEITALVESLDEAYLLEGESFRQAFALRVAEYRKKPFRPSSHAGMSYDDDPEGLKQQLDAFFTAEDGPGLPVLFSDPRRPVGLIAPHIDIRGGGTCFAHGYHALALGQPSDVYVILGTGHSGVENLFTAATLDFRTPLGTAEIDRELLELLAHELGEDPAAEEILHATEHVIEFQVIFLQHVFANRHRFKILPILCSFSYQAFRDEEEFARERARFNDFCRCLKTACRDSSRTVCFIASADLDHIGPRYGDSFIPHGGTVKSALEKDEQMLRALERLDVKEFIDQVSRERDARRICGFPPITAMMHSMEATSGSLLMLDHAQVDERNSFVSFTSMIFH